MAFNAGKYMQAVAGQKRTSGALQKGASQAASKQIQGAHFSIDEQIKYADSQEKAGSVFSKWKKGAGLLAGLAATAIGAPVIDAAMLAGGATYLGGKHGQQKAKKELNKSKFFKGSTGKMMDYMNKDITKSSIMAGAMAGAGAHFRMAGAKEASAAEGAGEITEEAVNLTEEELKTQALKQKEYANKLAGSGEQGPSTTVDAYEAGDYGGVDYNKMLNDELIQDASKPFYERQAWLDTGRKMQAGGEKLFGGIAESQGVQNLGYAAKGATSFGKQFGQKSTLWDIYKNINAAGSLAKGIGAGK